jgi:hypothetical protein
MGTLFVVHPEQGFVENASMPVMFLASMFLRILALHRLSVQWIRVEAMVNRVLTHHRKGWCWKAFRPVTTIPKVFAFRFVSVIGIAGEVVCPVLGSKATFLLIGVAHQFTRPPILLDVNIVITNLLRWYVGNTAITEVLRVYNRKAAEAENSDDGTHTRQARNPYI